VAADGRPHEHGGIGRIFTKFVLREAMREHLPAAIIDDRIKRRFATPFQDWFRTDWRSLIEDTLLGSCALASFVDLRAQQVEICKLLAGAPAAIGRGTLWRALSAEISLQQFAASAAPMGLKAA
jgi:hypothetical protein